MKRFLPIGLSPNLEPDDVWRSIKLLVQPWRYAVASAQTVLQQQLASYFSTTTAGVFLFNSGRSALLTYLQALDLPTNSAVALQAFTCNAVVNPILWAGLQPNYIDIAPDTLTMSPTDLAKKMTSQTKVLIIQHTFGQSAALNPLLEVARQHNLIVIEDCAHALGGRSQHQLLGTFADAAIFSFGRDKVISSVYGGALLVNTIAHQSAVTRQYGSLTYPNFSWVMQQLLHPIITFVAITTWYWLGFGRVLFALAQRCRVLSLAVSRLERQALQPDYFPKKLPGALASLALAQFNKLDRFNQHRLAIAQLYQQTLFPQQPLAESIFLRYTLRSQKRQTLFKMMQRQGIILGDWYWDVIVPAGSAIAQFGYVAGSCPVAEAAAQVVINLPTHIRLTPAAARNLAEQVKSYL